LGLSQRQLARLSGLSRQTVVGLENGSLEDLGVNRVALVTTVLGLQAAPLNTQVRSKKRGLWMAAKTASVSYASELAPEMLGTTLTSGEVQPSFVPHLVRLLDEVPVPLSWQWRKLRHTLMCRRRRSGAMWPSWPKPWQSIARLFGRDASGFAGRRGAGSQPIRHMAQKIAADANGRSPRRAQARLRAP
jgi:transcriptional regulator with XRE-family HTH domain